MGVESIDNIMVDEGTCEALTVLILSQSPGVCADVASVLENLPDVHVETQVLPLGPANDPMSISPRPNFVLIDAGAGTLEDVALIQKLRGDEKWPLVPIVALLERGSELGSVRAMRAGADDVLLHPVNTDEAQEVFKRVIPTPKASTPDQTALGKTIVFVHVSGGAGATTLAVNSAMALASKLGKDKTCLIDLDIQFGAAASLLDISRLSRIEDFVADPSRLDRDMLETLMISHKTGLRVLTTPRFAMPLDALNVDGVTKIMQLAKQGFAFTVVDLPMTVTSWTAAVLRAADVIYVVVELSVPAAHRTRRFLELLQHEGMSRLPLKIVANRRNGGLRSGSDVAAMQFAKAIGRAIDYSIPNDYGLISLSHGQGRAAVDLKPKSGFSKALKNMLSKDLGGDLFGGKSRSLFSFGRK